ncbi:NAD(P)-dependent oxidoreductase [Streptomyces sp. NPDC048385]|uniref:NAD(P)-dependent oxidoreductase n=1 Tax=Streptomyces sp. NPDC048385 TaxID=3155145 RepID=UPI003414C902
MRDRGACDVEVAMEIGFVGAGRMGRPMVRRLLAQGHRVHVCARTPVAREALARDGADPAASPAAAAQGVEILVLCLYGDMQVRAVCADEALAAALPVGAVTVVHTTGDPRTVVELARRGLGVIDAPVSGGPDDIAAGRLTVYAGGGAGQVEQVRPALAAYASPLLHVGPLGAGQRVKLLNNALFAAHLGLLADAVRLGGALALPEGVLLDALAQGSAASRAVSGAAAKGALSGLVESASAFLRKDLATARGMADGMELDLGALEPALGRLEGLLESAG